MTVAADGMEAAESQAATEEEEVVTALPASPDPPQASESESQEVAAGTARGGRHLFYNKNMIKYSKNEF